MAEKDRLSPSEVAEARERRLDAMRLQEIEENPLSSDQVAMFEMFEREAWPSRPSDLSPSAIPVRGARPVHGFI
jgi:hypothetical protein